MAGRPTKQGLDYFPLDVDFFNDEKIELVSARFGVKGEIITIRLLCKIYRNGYYTVWDEDECTLLAKRAGDGFTPSLVREIVYGLVRRGFFDESLLHSFGILSSKAIQKRYMRAVNDRKEIEIDERFWLIDKPKNAKISINRREMAINRREIIINHPINSQRKEKKSISLKFPYQEIISSWNSMCGNSTFSKVLKLTEARKSKIRSRLEEFGSSEEEQLLMVEKLFEKAQNSTFLRGENRSGWRATFDWFFENSRNWVKVLEGNYDNKSVTGYETGRGGDSGSRERKEYIARKAAEAIAECNSASG